jgi:7-carboxy-7-deazaguanine synthase
MRVCEIFYSIQGEGRWSGLPNVFIRTVGCNLRCSYCDTRYAYEGGTDMDIDTIGAALQQYPCRYCCLTGGEPLLQPDAFDLVTALGRKGYAVAIETNGSLPVTKFAPLPFVLISLDMKCPSSGMAEEMDTANIRALSAKDQLKVVIGSREDYDYGKDVCAVHRPACPVYFQPVWGFDTRTLAKWMLDDGLDARLGVQLHKVVWGERTKI